MSLTHFSGFRVYQDWPCLPGLAVCFVILFGRIRATGPQYMRRALRNLLEKIGETFSAGQRKDYEKAASRIVAALDSGKLKSTDKANLAAPIIDAGQPEWLSPLDGIDWVELRLFAEEHKLPMETVNDLLAVLRVAIQKM